MKYINILLFVIFSQAALSSNLKESLSDLGIAETAALFSEKEHAKAHKFLKKVVLRDAGKNFRSASKFRKAKAVFFQCVVSKCNAEKWVAFKKRKGLRAGSFPAKNFVQKTIGELKYTPLMIAAGLNHEATATWLLELGAEVNTADAHEFTALHFAALQRKPNMLLLLNRHDGDLAHENLLHGTPVDLWKLAHIKTLKKQEILFYNTDLGEKETITGKDFKTLTGSIFAHGLLKRPLRILRYWSKSDFGGTAVSNFGQDVLEQAQNFSSSHTNVYINTISRNDREEALSLMGFGIYANKPLGEGSLITEYTGEWLGHARAGSDYTTQVIDGDKLRGYGALCGDALPNSVVVNAHSVAGVPERQYVMAIRNIEPGEGIYWDYSTDGIKIITYQEAMPKALDDLLPEMMEEFGTWSQNVSRQPDGLHQVYLRSAILYVLQSPAVLLRLILEEKVSLLQLKKFEAFPIYSQLLHLKTFGPILNAILAHIETGAPRAVAMRDYLIAKLGTEEFRVLASVAANYLQSSNPVKNIYASTIQSTASVKASVHKELDELLATVKIMLEEALQKKG